MLTPEQIAKINEKKATMPEALQRDPNVDYYHGWFFVTLNTRNEVPVLSICEGDAQKKEGEKGAPRACKCHYCIISAYYLRIVTKMRL